MDKPKCAHPADQRWGYSNLAAGGRAWMCCLCCRYFWGLKTETPATDIMGRPT